MIDLDRYSFVLPERLIARKPASPRDNAKLFIYDRASGAIRFDIFRNIDRYIPKKSFFVLNDTKVLPARLPVRKQDTGGRAELLLLLNEYRGKRHEFLKALSDRKLVVGQYLAIGRKNIFQVVGQEEKIFFLRILVSDDDLKNMLGRHGRTPLPKYIGSSGFSERVLRDRYQSIFAHTPASVAAPTASLHFTNRVLDGLEKKHVQRVHVTLHVGMGTFAPLEEKNFRTKKLFTELYQITPEAAKTINTLRREGSACIAVGTTATRTLESSAHNGKVRSGSGSTQLFVYPPYHFQVVDALVTNFHIPKSSLMLLVDAFLRHKKSPHSITDLYAVAIQNNFRFYSFGDAMLIL